MCTLVTQVRYCALVARFASEFIDASLDLDEPRAVACTPMQDENGEHDDHSCRSPKIWRTRGERMNNSFHGFISSLFLYSFFLTICVEN